MTAPACRICGKLGAAVEQPQHPPAGPDRPALWRPCAACETSGAACAKEGHPWGCEGVCVRCGVRQAAEEFEEARIGEAYRAELGAAIMSPALEMLFERHKERRVALWLIVAFGISLIIVAIPLTVNGVAPGKRIASIFRLWPFLLGGFAFGSAHYLLLRVLRGWWASELAAQKALIEKAVSSAQEAQKGAAQVDELRRDLRAAREEMETIKQDILFAKHPDAIFLDEDTKEKIERTPPLALTAIQMFEAIRATESQLRREFAKRYLAAYVTWDCWLYNRTGSEDGEIETYFRLFPPLNVANLYANFKHAQIVISAQMRRNPFVANLEDGAAVTVKGRIWLICLYAGYGGMAFQLDDVEIRERQVPDENDGGASA